MCPTKSRNIRYAAYLLCMVCCPGKLIVFLLSAGAAAGAFSTFDFRLPLILTGWTCISLAAFMMLRTRKDLLEASQPATPPPPTE